MSDRPKAKPGRRLIFWGIAIPITIGLLVPAYIASNRVKSVESELADDLQWKSQVREDHVKWSKMARDRESLRHEISMLKQDLVAAMKSFEREELHDALRRGVKAANPDQAIVLAMPGMMWGARAWVWLPESGHQLSMQIKSTDILPEDIEGADDIDLDLTRDLPARQLHKIQFWIEEQRGSNDCIVRLSFNDEMLLERTLHLDPYNSSSQGGSSEVFAQPRIVSSNWTWNPVVRELFQRRVWFTLEQEKFGLRAAKKGQDSRTAELSCHLGIATEGTFYAPKATRFMLKREGFQWKEVDDVESEFHGLLKITGLGPKEEN